MSNLLKRLEIIQTAIDLGDEDVVALQATTTATRGGETDAVTGGKRG